MLSTIWDFAKDPANQAVLSWIGGGIAAVAAGIWAVVRFRAKSGHHKPSRPTVSVSADRGSVAAGGDFKNSPVDIDTRGGSKR
jgi:hypothetical protein